MALIICANCTVHNIICQILLKNHIKLHLPIMKSQIIVAIAFISIALNACSKKNNTGPYTSVTQAFAEVAPKSKTVTLDAGAGGSFYGNSGSRYVFPPNIFRTASGAPVTGAVQVQVTEYLNKADMLLSGMLPVSAGKPLISGGEIYVRVTQNNTELSIQGAYRVNMPMNATPDPDMKIFSGRAIWPPTQSLAPIGVVWWPNHSTSSAVVLYNNDTTTIIADSLNMSNVDRFMTTPNYQHFFVKLSVQGDIAFDDKQVSVFTLFTQYNTVLPMYSINNHVGEERSVPNIPVYFIAATIINGQLYAGITGATPATGANYSVVMKPTTPKELKAQIKAL